MNIHQRTEKKSCQDACDAIFTASPTLHTLVGLFSPANQESEAASGLMRYHLTLLLDGQQKSGSDCDVHVLATGKSVMSYYPQAATESQRLWTWIQKPQKMPEQGRGRAELFSIPRPPRCLQGPFSHLSCRSQTTDLPAEPTYHPLHQLPGKQSKRADLDESRVDSAVK